MLSSKWRPFCLGLNVLKSQRIWIFSDSYLYSLVGLENIIPITLWIYAIIMVPQLYQCTAVCAGLVLALLWHIMACNDVYVIQHHTS